MAEITLLDGGMGQELVHRAGDKPTPLWSTQVMVDHPGLVAEVHRDFTKAGATIATTNTYAIHHDRLVGTAMENQFKALHQRVAAFIDDGGSLEDISQVDQSEFMHLETADQLAGRNAHQAFQQLEFAQ